MVKVLGLVFGTGRAACEPRAEPGGQPQRKAPGPGEREEETGAAAANRDPMVPTQAEARREGEIPCSMEVICR